MIVGAFDKPEDSNEWAEKKGLLRYCHKHNSYFDPSIGCRDCKLEESHHEPISSSEFNPFRMCKSGYKYYAGSYWRRIDNREASKTNRQIVNDKDGIWEKVSIEEATFELEIVDEPSWPIIATKNSSTQEAEICPCCSAKTTTFQKSKEVDYEFYKCSNDGCNRVFGVDELRILRSKIKTPEVIIQTQRSKVDSDKHNENESLVAPKVAIQPIPNNIDPNKPPRNKLLVAPKSLIQPVEAKSAEKRPHPSLWGAVKRMVFGTQVFTDKNPFKEEKRGSVAWFGNQYWDPKAKKWKNGPKGRRV